MGVLPLQYKEGQNAGTLGLTGREALTIDLDDTLRPLQEVTVTATREDGSRFSFQAIARIDTPIEIDYYRHGGILQMVLRGMLGGA